MKKILQVGIGLLICFITLPAFFQSGSFETAMEKFHDHISTTFHPAEEGNLKPLRADAEGLLTAAENWKKTSIPANFKTDETKKALKQLVEECTAIKKAVKKNADDAALTKLASAAHDTFHKIIGECQKSEK